MGHVQMYVYSFFLYIYYTLRLQIECHSISRFAINVIVIRWRHNKIPVSNLTFLFCSEVKGIDFTILQ